jgi:SAM-dependent methyltransferase
VNAGGDYAPGYEARRLADPVLRARLRTMERVVHELAAPPVERVLDIGCGTGRVTAMLGNACVVGLDPSPQMLRAGRAKGLQLVRGDGQALPFAARSFDLIFSTDSAFSQLDFARALPECARVLRPGSALVVHKRAGRVWSPRRPLGLMSVPGTIAARSPERLLAEAAAAGFVLERAELYRWLRFSPYLVRVPPRVELPIWNHGMFVFRRSS